MSVNFLLGFTGVLSFGHAAYFGLGAYGAGFALKFLAPSSPLSLLIGMLFGGLAGALLRHADRAPARRLFRHGDDRVRTSILLHRLSVELADRRRRRLARLLAPAARLRVVLDRHPIERPMISTISCWSVSPSSSAVMAFILRSPFGRTMVAIRENERRARFLGIPMERHIWIAFTLSCFFMGFAGALYALLNNFADPRACITANRATSS